MAGAAETLQDVHVETFGSLSKREKVEFILEQLRLTLAKQDYVRAHIVAGKVSRKQLQEEGMEEYKTRFYHLLTLYHRRHAKDALELAKDYHAIYSTRSTTTTQMQVESTTTTTTDEDDDTDRMEALKATIVFLALSPYGNEQQDMMHRIQADTSPLEQLPTAFQKVIELFLKQEIIAHPMPGQVEELETLSQVTQDDLASHWKQVLHRRIIQHNIRIVAKYYRRIRLVRLAQLLQLPVDRAEQEVASMVSDGVIYAKMDRPQGIVRFSAPQSPEQVLSDWAADIDKVLHLVETTSHLINKENMTAQ